MSIRSHLQGKFTVSAVCATLLLCSLGTSQEVTDTGDGGGAEAEECVDCQGDEFGTSLTWYSNAAAAKLAKEQDKLVFLIQVSGNFAREEFT